MSTRDIKVSLLNVFIRICQWSVVIKQQGGGGVSTCHVFISELWLTPLDSARYGIYLSSDLSQDGQ